MGLHLAVKQSRVPEEGGARRQIIVPKGEYNGRLRPIYNGRLRRLRPFGEFFVLGDGRRCFADDADESFIKQWEAEKRLWGTCNWDECTLRELSALISPHLNKGAIEFVAVLASSEDAFYERLLVRSDGSVEYHKCVSDNCPLEGGRNPTSEYYEPESSKAARSRKH
jgi:hypothetical protein